jgi:hypothetical protein
MQCSAPCRTARLHERVTRIASVLQDLWKSMQPHVDSAAYINYIDKVSHFAFGPR